MAELERSFLGEASTRLSRIFRLRGLISPRFDRGEKIIPVALVADGTEPGMGDTRGLQFVGSINTAGGGAQPVLGGIRFGVEAWIDFLAYRSNTAATEMTLRWAPAGDAAAITLAALTQTPLGMIDRNSTLRQSSVSSFGSNATAAPTGQILHRIIPVANVDVFYTQGGLPIFFPAGAVIWITHTIAATVTITIRGRTF